jgi:hypothetical protein
VFGSVLQYVTPIRLGDAIGGTQSGRGINPADTDYLGAAMHADDCTQRADPNNFSGEVGGDEVKELVDVRCATVHHRNVLDRPGGAQAFVEHLQRPLASPSLTGFVNDSTGKVDHRLDRQQ